MSRSFKKNPVKKDKGFRKDKYWKHVRNKVKHVIRNNDIEQLEEQVLPDAKEIINDYDYMDWVNNCINEDNCACMKKDGNKDKCMRK